MEDVGVSDVVGGGGVDSSSFVDLDTSESYVIQFSQEGQTMYYLPRCEEDMKPFISQMFTTLEQGMYFYKRYAVGCGFDVRNGCSHKDKKDQIVVLKYLVCTREGYKVGQNKPSRRTRVSNRVGCNAKIIFRYVGMSGYMVKSFVERHTHRFVDDPYRQFMKSNRNMDTRHKKFVLNCSRANVGHVKSHRLYKEIVGGYGNMGASVVDFKKNRRDLLAYFAGSDAQMLIDRLFAKKELCSAYYFDYDVDRLKSIFWVDLVSRKNFAFFGEVVSFDATYRTNKYNLVFVPFTGLDHHKRCVTFGAGLVLKEDFSSYVRLLENFRKAMGNDPRIIVTDQDLSMKSVVAQIFPNTRHRLCMWYIMQKVPDKTKTDVDGGEPFRKKLNSKVWTHELEPVEFEEKWLQLVNEYELGNKKWFNDMFSIRQFWIPAYFRDVMFGGLVRTTSISEVQNKFFGHFTNRNLRLVELLLHYESALDAQRHNQAKLNHDCMTMLPNFKTEMQLEKHASEHYTLTVFLDIQKEICAACFSCRITGMQSDNDAVTYKTREGDMEEVKTVYYLADGNVVCSCRLFQRIGYPCRHMFVVFKNMGMDKIPMNFVLSRWTKSATVSPIFSIDGTLVQQCFEMEERQILMNALLSDFYCCMGLLERHPDRLKDFTQLLKEQKAALIECSGGIQSAGSSNAQMAETFAGTSVPSTITVFPPTQAKNKGSGKRIMSSREAATAGKRRCGKCKKIAFHNSRTCTEQTNLE